MNREHTTKWHSVKTARFATLCALLQVHESSVPSPRRSALALSALLAYAALLALSAAPALAAPAIHEFTASFGAETSTPADPYPLSEPSDVAVDNSSGPSAGDVYVTDSGNHRVEKFSPAGEFILTFGKGVDKTTGANVCTAASHDECQPGTAGTTPGTFESPSFIAVDPSAGSSAGDVYVVDSGDRTISKFGPSGDLITSWGTGGQLAVPNSEPEVIGLGVDENGDVWTATYFNVGGQNGHRVYEFSPTAELLHTAGDQNSVDVGFTVAPSGEAFYTKSNGDYEAFSATGEGLHREIPGSALAAASSGFFYTITGSEVSEFEPSTRPFGSPFGSGTLTGPSGVAIDAATDDVYVAQSGPGDVAVFDFTGPVISTGPIESPGHAAATLTGHVDPLSRGEVTGCEFEYVDEAEFKAHEFESAATAPCEPATHFSGAEAVHAAIPGLTAETTYHYRLVAENAKGTVPASERTFSLRAVFGVETEPPTGVQRKAATFHGSLDPDGIETHYHFEYVDAAHYHGGTSNPYSEGSSTPDSGPISGGSTQSVEQSVEGLTTQTAYHYRLVAENKYGATYGPDEPFETVSFVLGVKTDPPSPVGAESATLHGSYTGDAEGGDTHCYFRYGTDETYGESTPEVDYGSATGPQAVKAELTGLSPHHTYHFRLVCRNTIGTTSGEDEHLQTIPFPSIRSLTTQTVGPELVELKAEVNPNGFSASYTIHYGTEAGNYSAGTSHGTLGVGNEFEEVTATFTGLEPNTEYHYQLTAEDANGEAKTTDRTFTTERSSTEEREAEHCPNTNLREEDNSLAVPDCRAYEKITPNAKEGGEVDSDVTLAPGGERSLYFSQGVFSGTAQDEFTIPYLAHRTETGWVTQAAYASSSRIAGYQPEVMHNYSPELDRWLFAQIPGLEGEQGFNSQSGFISMGFADGSYNLHASPTVTLEEGGPRSYYFFLEVLGASNDMSHLFILTASRDLPLSSDPRPDQYGPFPPTDRIYEVSGADTPSPTMKLAAEVPLGLGGHGSGCLIDGYETGSDTLGNVEARFVSTDGSHLFYTAPVENVAGSHCGEGTPNPLGIFAKVGEAAPVQLNVPPPSQCSAPAPCAGAPPATPRYYGASEDGSRTWFTTSQPLIDSDRDSTNDLYLAKLEPGGTVKELVQASAGAATDPTAGEGAGVQGVVRVSADGTHAAFVATGVLTTEPSESGPGHGQFETGEFASQGADNLYVYDAESGQTKFVARLCSGPEQSGSVADPACREVAGDDSPLWRPGELKPSAVLTPDGNYLLFTSFGRLTPDKTSNVEAVFRYDFQTGRLIRVSFGHDGNDANGNDSRFAATIETGGAFLGYNELTEDGGRSISQDGSTVIFSTAAPLVSRDTNAGAHPTGNCTSGSVGTGCDVYEWEEEGHGTCTEAGGCISLISDGKAPHGASSAVIGSTGRDIVFQTTAGLIPEDTDGIGDFYDARVDGGFHAQHPPPACTSPEACRPAAESEPKSSPLGTSEFAGPPNPKYVFKPRKHCRKGFVLKHDRCLKKASKKHKRARRRAAGAHRGGAK
ncbi:MAG: hypothetical protein WB507_04835 [Solirubrobacterales bacterium]